MMDGGGEGAVANMMDGGGEGAVANMMDGSGEGAVENMSPEAAAQQQRRGGIRRHEACHGGMGNFGHAAEGVAARQRWGSSTPANPHERRVWLVAPRHCKLKVRCIEELGRDRAELQLGDLPHLSK